MKSLVSKNKVGGVVTSTIMGVGGLVIAVIIILVLVSTILNAGLFVDVKRRAVNHNVSVSTVVNETGSYFGNRTLPGASCAIDTVKNQTGSLILDSNNYTTSSSLCIIYCDGCSGGSNNTLWKINSTTTYYGDAEDAVYSSQGNFTSGINNVSEKIPTILLIVAVVFLFGALILLMRNANQMGVTSNGGSL